MAGQHRKTPYTSVSVTPEAADALRRVAVVMSAMVGQRMSLSDALLTAEKLAVQHRQSIEACAIEAGLYEP